MNDSEKKGISVETTGASLITIAGEIAAASFERHRKAAVKAVSESFEIKGFRRGHAPEHILMERIGEMRILEEMAERALREEYPKMLAENSIEAIGHPKITITKLAAKNPLGFKIETAVMPKFDLPDYKEIARKTPEETPADVTDKEIEDVLLELRKMHRDENGNEPEIDDLFVKKLGNFADVAAFKTKIKENMMLEKKRGAKEKRRMRIFDLILEKTNIVIPGVIVDWELDRMYARMEGDIENMGLNAEDYLKHLGKTSEELRLTWRPEAEKQAKIQLVLNEIAAKEKIEPNEKDFGERVSFILESQKNADPERVRDYVRQQLTNQKVIDFLEGE
ncbi:hypothetical protein L0Y46_04480 [bacterium]|nr:hypothetical protein [bacterium]